ncbi:MAG: pseudaminic acid synthase [Lachnospiraceae bacterium]|nr:pseudaminic acid synthase [Lachnospiraceae bacterium]MDD4524941.1 pseudaminic acid synthase [Lachnospiraceae bacterium]
MRKEIKIADRPVGGDNPVYVVAEMSANHLQSYDRAVEIIHAAAEAGADAIKLQTYTADTITIDSDEPCFRITGGTIWDGTTLYKLYKEAYTPWEWQPDLCAEASKLGLDCFSSPFDPTAVAFMEEMKMPAYKIASYEITDIPLIRLVASKGKPVILATGVATEGDIKLAIDACLGEGNDQIILLKCVSAYPTPYEDMNLRMIPTLQNKFGVVTGLSDHSAGSAASVAAVALGARMIEKHLTLKRSDGGPDGAFSMEPEEFARMVTDIRIAEKALGKSEYCLTPQQERERGGARSLFVVKDVKKGDELTPLNVRSIRPGDGLPPIDEPLVYGSHAKHDLKRGTPLKKEDFL